MEKHEGGYIAYPLGLKGVVVGHRNSCEEALSDVKPSIMFHFETFGDKVIQTDQPVVEVFVAEARSMM